LPGAAGSGVTSGQHDTVILDRPNADVTVTLSTGTHNIRKLYVREALNITGGSLNVNYGPSADSTPISAQFSAPVMLDGGSVSVHTLQVDVEQQFMLHGGALTFNTIALMPQNVGAAQLMLTGNVPLNALGGVTANISNGTGAGRTGIVNLGGENREVNVTNGAAAIDVAINVPVVDGGLTKVGAGTLALNASNTYAGDTAVQAGRLKLGVASLEDTADVYLSTGGLLELDFSGATDVIDSLFIDGISQATGTWGATGSGAQFTSDLLAGTGLLQVTTFVPPPLSGDYNEDGVVDAADYVVWRDNLGSETALPNDDTVGVGPDDYDRWKAHFGETNLGGTGSAASSGVPEPHSVCLFAIAYTVLQFAWRLR
jgi:autotransporter-associated beta strand protein